MDFHSVIAALILTGAAVFGFLYHVRTRWFDISHREPADNYPAYELVDWYLKLSTLGIALAALVADHRLLLEVHDQPLLVVLGLLIAAGALALFAGGIWTLGAEFSPAHKSRVPSGIVMRGPYRFIRHPIYTSNILLLSGLFVLSGSLWIVINLAILLAWYLPTIVREEKVLGREFAEYREYMQRSGRFFPRLGSRASDATA